MYLTHKDLTKYWVIDIETESLSPTVIHCIVVKNVGTHAVTKFIGPDYTSFIHFVESQPSAIWVGHNIVSFDIPVINKLLKTNIVLSNCCDTLVLSYLYYPRQPGGHSLESWGERFRYPKGDFHDFSHFSPEMLSYCERDVELTETLFLRLTSRMLSRGFSERSCALEHKIRQVIDVQQRNGFYFDIARAEALHFSLRAEQERLHSSIQQLFPPLLTAHNTYGYKLRADGLPYSSYGKHVSSYPKVTHEGDTYTTWNYQPFNIASPTQRVSKLLGLGWEPDSWTPKGNPQADEDSLVRASERLSRPEVQAMADWLVLQGRASMLETWLKAVDRNDSCIHGSVASCGASSRRATHWNPNTANIPSNEAAYGSDVRALWQARPGRVLVGGDAKAVQMRMFGHYLGNPEVAALYISGDPHQRNADAAGIDRKKVKNCFYAMIFGARDKKLGSTGISNGSAADGLRIRQALYSTTPGFEALVEATENEYYTNDGFMLCVDGGYVRCPSPHAALNYKIQSAEACLMKLTDVETCDRATKKGLDYLQVGFIHDELQFDCSHGDAEELGNVFKEAIKDCGEELNFSVPMEGDFKTGPTWRETH